MIVLLAILNDTSIMTIAYDNVRITKKPVRWDMKKVLGVATGLGLIGVVSSFGMLYIGISYFGLTGGPLQSLVYLKLSVAGQMLFFVARTRGHFWTVRPALPLFSAIAAVQTFVTIITAQGILVPAIGWYHALFVWGYALAWFVLTDFAKGPIYNLLESKAKLRR